VVGRGGGVGTVKYLSAFSNWGQSDMAVFALGPGGVKARRLETKG